MNVPILNTNKSSEELQDIRISGLKIDNTKAGRQEQASQHQKDGSHMQELLSTKKSVTLKSKGPSSGRKGIQNQAGLTHTLRINKDGGNPGRNQSSLH